MVTTKLERFQVNEEEVRKSMETMLKVEANKLFVITEVDLLPQVLRSAIDKYQRLIRRAELSGVDVKPYKQVVDQVLEYAGLN